MYLQFRICRGHFTKMKMPWLIVNLILILKIILIDGNCQVSEYDDLCSCLRINSNYEMSCSINSRKQSNDFVIEYASRQTVMITCDSEENLSAFNFNISSVAKAINILALRSCTLGDATIINISKLVGATGAKKLIISDVRDNKNITLNKSHFEGFSQITSLEITDNNYLNLDEDLLEHVPNIELLILRNNKLKSIPKDFFQFVPNLRSLELGNNNIQTFEAGTFRNLPSLTFLNVWTNELRELHKDTFADLTSLKSLNLLNNKLSTLPPEIFAENLLLNKIILSKNSFSNLPDDLFRNNKNLTSVKLQSVVNLTSLPSRLLSDLKNLTQVWLNGCNLKSIPEDVFEGSTNLKEIFLHNNALQTLPVRLFEGLRYLEKLQLNSNEIDSLPNNLLESCEKLKELNINYNNITAISRFSFAGLFSLQKLSASRNKISSIDAEAFKPLSSVTDINLSRNNITDVNSRISSSLGSISVFNDCLKLENLDLSYNKIPSLFSDWIVTPRYYLRSLDLSHNVVNFLTIDDLDFKHSQDFTLNLSDNNITNIYMFNYEERFTSEERSNIALNIENNPVKCDCFLYDFLRYLDGSMNESVRAKLKIRTGSMKCLGSKEYKDVPLEDLNSKDYKCPASKSYLDNSDLCPHACDLQIRPSSRTFIFNCAFKNYTKAPEALCSLKDPSYLCELDLSGNFIKDIPDFKQIGYNKVTNLVLSFNQISSIPKEIFSNNELKRLKLDYNQIGTLPSDVLNAIQVSRKIISLGHNPWKCDCKARDFYNFIQKFNNSVEDSDSVTCEKSHFILKRLTVNELCPDEKQIFLVASLGLAILGFITGLMAFFYYRYEVKIKVWLYANNICLWFVTEEELDKDKIYDAFISYSHRDEEFVVNELITNLENGPRSFKLCVHFRDWVAGGWIPSQIIKSIKNSRRTIVVLSSNFINSDWGKLEFKTAHKEAFEEGRARLIVLLYGDVGPIDKLDPDLQAYLKMNTYVKWGDPWFWDKLRYALPHKSDLALKNFKSNHSSGPHPSAQLNFNKLEVHPLSGKDFTIIKEKLTTFENGNYIIKTGDDECKKLSTIC